MGAADNFFSKADQALKKRNLDYAIELYQQGLAIDPDRLDERKMLRSAEVRRVQENGGNTMGGTALKFKSLGTLGKIKKLGMAKKWEEQILEIEKFLKDAPQNADQNMNLANAFVQTDRMDEAIWAYNCVLEVMPQNVDALKALGRLYEKLQDMDSAITCWEKVRQAKPEDQEAGKAVRDLAAATMMQRADARRKSEDGSFRELLKDEDEASKLEQKQKIIRTEDDARAAVVLKKEDIAKDPENTRMWRELGDLHLKAKEFDQAKSAYQKAIEIDPQDLYANEKLGNLQEQLFEHHIQTLRRKFEASPDDQELKKKLDALLEKHNSFMLEEMNRRVSAHPTDYGLKFKLGLLLQRNDCNDDAIAQFQNAAKDPKFATNSYYRIGQCFFSKKLFDLAIKQFTAALNAISEEDSSMAKNVRYDLASAHHAKGDNEQALELLEEIMAVDINFRDVSKKVDEIRGM